MRKILYLQWDCFGEEYIVKAFRKAGLEVELYPIPYGKMTLRHDVAFENELKEKLLSASYEFLFSFNYFPAVALAADAVKTTYVSWTYDSPFMYLFSETINLPINIAFCFDRDTVNILREKGVNRIHYLPMAAPVSTYDAIHNGFNQRQQYTSEISFVGSLYSEDRQNQMKYLSGVNSAVAEYLELLINLQLQNYQGAILEQFLRPEIMTELRRVCPIPLEQDEMQSLEWMYANYFLAREVTARERTQLINRLSNECPFVLYTPEPSPHLPHVKNCGPVDYCDQMPLVFKNSKINLNITLKSIYSGIPLRAFDIMGCGGFLLSDYQKDYEDLFIAGEDYVYYTTPDDLVKKVDYYLSHASEREAIAKNGYRKVKEKHTYDIRVREILEMIG